MTRKLLLILTGLCPLLLFLLASVASADQLIVDPDTANTCDSSPADPVTTPRCFRTIDAAVNYAAGDLAVNLIFLKPAVYTVSSSAGIALRSGVSLQGGETARTILSGAGSNTIITADSISAATVIRNLTLTNAAVGIAVSGSSQLDIKNNVFRLPGGIGITSNNSAATQIMNNTFYDIATAISTTTDTTLNIINNIFSTYTTAFPDAIAPGGILDNVFTGSAGSNVDTVTNGNIISTDPLFADVNAGDAGDFHLRSGSAAINAGNASAGTDALDGTPPDVGAYGGSFSDTLPFPVSGLIISGSTADSITLSWNTSTDYRLAGYNVYYGSAPGSYTAGPLDAGTGTTYTITGLTAATGPTGKPDVYTYEVANQTIYLWWWPAVGATGYEIRYAAAPTTPPPPPAADPNAIDVGNALLTQLNGLTNGTTYNIIVVPYAEAAYSLIVKAYYVQNDAAKMSAASNVVSHSIGGTTYGAAATASDMIVAEPGPIVPLPNLPNSGCFIATAAYGNHASPQVRILRTFRDQYLLTNAAGRAFVRWYYAQGPVGAQFLNAHPALKPIVRAALLPAVGGALFLTRTTFLEKTLVVMLLCVLSGLFWRRKRLTAGWGGKQ